MALTFSNEPQYDWNAPDFQLKGIDDQQYSLDSFREARALVVIFICNHCPYVIAVQDRINQLAKDYAGRGVKLIGINSNDAQNYPEDSFEAMKQRAQEKGYVFPYLFDETQATARAYRAVCTPDPYVFENVDGAFKLRYHGRIDDNWKNPDQVKTRELASALDAILTGAPVSRQQAPAMGCSIKWKE